jgi:polysaccharide pyruvyl transferase WcaK-like protein
MASVIAFINPAVSTENVGDLFIVDSLKRILAHDREHSFDVDPRKPITRRDIDRMNEADAAVICGTNLWYKRMPKPGRWTFSLADLNAVRVPIVPLGVGTTRHSDADNDFEPETLAQIRRIHESCAVGSARDWRTAEVLNAAGVTNVSMTGCPTLYRSLAPEWRLRPRRAGAKKVVVTVRKGAARNVRKLLGALTARGLEPVVAAQQDPDNFLAGRSIPLVRKAWPTLYQYDMKPYTDLIDEAVGAIGWRLHGNMIHLAHGNPAILFSNCSRGESFCETFGLPRVPSPDHVDLPDGRIEEMVDRLLDPATFAALPRHYAEHRATMARFIQANGLRHNLGEAAAAATDARTPVNEGRAVVS